MQNNSALQSLINILNISGGRDKYARIIQYFCKFLANYLKSNYVNDPKLKNQTTALILQLSRTSSALSNFRKILRFGGPVQKQQSINNRISLVLQEKVKGTDLQWQYVKIIQEIGASLYALTDHFLWFYNIGIFLVKNPEKKQQLQYYNDWLWMWDAVFGIISNIIKMTQVKSNISELQKQQLQQQNSENTKIGINLQQKQDQMTDLVVDTTRLIVDIPVITHGLNPELIGPQMGGLLGAVSSAIGIYQLYKVDQKI